MSQQDRGAYTPQTDAHLAFDARSPRGGSRRPLPMALIGSGVVLLALIVAVVMYYRSGVRSTTTGTGGPPAVGQPVGAVKTAPPAGTTSDDPFSNLDVYAAQNVPTSPAAAPKPTFAPAPEQPKPRPAPAPGGLTVQTVEASGVHAVPAAPANDTAAKPAPAKPAATETAAASAPTPGPAKTAAAAPAAAKPVATAAAVAPGGPAQVQIGAFSSTALADKGFGEIAKGFPAPMAGKTKRIEPLERDGKTLYRGLIQGFPDKAAATSFCATLKAAGRTCLVRG